MQAAVTKAWTEFIRQYEGYCDWIYLDTHNPPLPTTGIGNLIGSNSGLSDYGLALPFRVGRGGRYALESEIKEEFKRLRDLKISGSGYAYEKYAKLFLDASVIDFIVGAKLLSNEPALVETFPDFRFWPANAQLAVSNMAWLMGPYFAAQNKWPNFTKAINSGDFAAAADLCKDKDGWEKERNRVNRDHLRWADIVTRNSMDTSVLWRSAPVPTVAPVAPGYVSLSGVKQALDGKINKDGRTVQTALKQLGLYKLVVDGQCGKYTQAAIQAFCLQHKLEAKKVEEWLPVLMDQSLEYEVRS
jgi:hypothetical protein